MTKLLYLIQARLKILPILSVNSPVALKEKKKKPVKLLLCWLVPYLEARANLRHLFTMLL